MSVNSFLHVRGSRKTHPLWDSSPVGGRHDDRSRVPPAVHVETLLVVPQLVLVDVVDELFGLEFLAGLEQGRRLGGEELVYDGPEFPPFGSVGHEEEPFAPRDDVRGHGRGGPAGGDGGLFVQEFFDDRGIVEEDPILPTHPDLKHLTVLSCPSLE